MPAWTRCFVTTMTIEDKPSIDWSAMKSYANVVGYQIKLLHEAIDNKKPETALGCIKQIILQTEAYKKFMESKK